jgi:hypothetical protein
MTEDESIEPIPPTDPETRTSAPHEDPEFPHIPYPIIRSARGSPYYIDPLSGMASCLSKPGTPPLTSEIVRQELENFP